MIIRESENSFPTLIATFNYGVEKTVDLRRMSVGQIEETLGSLETYSQQVAKTIKM